MTGSDGLLVALDAGSPRVSVAVGARGDVLAERSAEIAHTSRRLMAMIEEVLAACGAGRHEIRGVVALRGPGSFTGLRVGLATALGLHQALAVPATALPSLLVLAAAAEAPSGTVVAAVDALRGEWFAQAFAAPQLRPLGDPELVPARELGRFAPATVVGFQVTGAVAAAAAAGLAIREPGPLAGAALRLVHRHPPRWDEGLLTRPLYLRPPAVSRPGPTKRVSG